MQAQRALRHLSAPAARAWPSSCLTTSQARRVISSQSASKTAFPMVPRNRLPEKPRKTGLTEIRGPYYNPVGVTYLKDLLSDWGEYVDGVKFAGGSFALMPEDRLREFIETAHEHGAYVSTGGFIEHLLASSNGDRGLIEKYLKACKDVGFDVLEISTGFISISPDDWQNLIDLTASYGLKPKPEIGIQIGAGGDASVEELESSGTRDVKWLTDRATKFIDAGAELIMIESEGITENVRSWKTNVISGILSSVPSEKIMFEAADPAVFQYYIQNVGADVNVFVDHSQITQLATQRRGQWGTGKTFGRIVTFPSD